MNKIVINKIDGTNLPVANILPLAEPRQDNTTNTGIHHDITPSMWSPHVCKHMITNSLYDN